MSTKVLYSILMQQNTVISTPLILIHMRYSEMGHIKSDTNVKEVISVDFPQNLLNFLTFVLVYKCFSMHHHMCQNRKQCVNRLKITNRFGGANTLHHQIKVA
ncbi:hypothetical protein GOODEAATRI_005679 [Goodea atripinnis]|uniref:Uncharacterized protein n=1 Tax=Goodea atripinnis TaxID=208336 RepID=A0ABV0P1P9_9TELE